MARRVSQCSVRIVLLASIAAINAAAAGFDDRNAADWYQRAFEEMAALTTADWDVLDAVWNDPLAPPPPELRALLARAAPLIDLARRGANMEYSDFGLDYEQGVDLLLPHLSQIRSLSTLVRHDVMVRLHDGDTTGAADRIATIYRMSQHMKDDNILISSLVGQAIFTAADQVAQTGFDRQAFGATESTTLLRALERIDRGDPFGVGASFAVEGDIMGDWLLREHGDMAGRPRLMETFGWADDDERVMRIVDMSDEAFAEDVALYRRLTEDLTAAIARRPTDAARLEIDRIAAAVETGAYGDLSLLMAPHAGRLLDRMIDADKRITDRVASLRGLIDGTAHATDFANAAYGYLEAARRASTLPSPLLAVLRAADDAREQPDETDRSALRERGREVIAQLRAASALERCDFSGLRSSSRVHLAPVPLVGLCDALRLLQFEAAHRVAAGDMQGASDQLIVAYRVAAHLTGDDTIVAALLAHAVVRRAMPLVEQVVRDEDARRGCAQPLREAVARIGARDPFGYADSVEATRKSLTGWVYYQIAPSEPEDRAAVKAAIDAWDAERLLNLLAVFEQLNRATVRRASDEAVLEDLTPLRGVIALDAFDSIASEVGDIAAALSAGDITNLSERSIVSIGNIAERRRAAGRDLAHALKMLGDE